MANTTIPIELSSTPGIVDNSNATAITIDSSENVGIGVSPSYKLHISGTSGSNILRVQDTGNNAGIGIGADATNGAEINYGGVDTLRFVNVSTERMRITSAGTLSFHGITGRATGLTGHVSISEQSNNRSYFESATTTTGSTSLFGFMNPNGIVGQIFVGGSATTYTTSSDYRLKENVVTDWDATTRLKQLKPSRFNFIGESDRTVDGFLAHEVQDIVPEAITGVKDEMQEEEYEVTPAVLDEDGNVVTEAVMGTREVPKYQGIDQSKLVPLLVKTIQELEARITTLENA